MKIACSSASFARDFAAGELTELEWLDLCANELELDGVVFSAAHFSRTDTEYFAQLKKSAADLGLTVAAVAAGPAIGDGTASDLVEDGVLDAAVALGAPLVLVRAPEAGDDARAWGAFTDRLQQLARTAKSVNVTLGLQNVPGTLCATPADLRRAAKDVDSSWLRFALDPVAPGAADGAAAILPKTVLATHTVERLAAFGQSGDPVADDLIARLARFRGFVVLDRGDETAPRASFHSAVERFARERNRVLAANVPG
jgi:hypothetical protein